MAVQGGTRSNAVLGVLRATDATPIAIRQILTIRIIEIRSPESSDYILLVPVKENDGLLDRSVVRSWYNGSALEDVEIDFVNEAFCAQFNVDAII
jgi:hypothetical protein